MLNKTQSNGVAVIKFEVVDPTKLESYSLTTIEPMAVSSQSTPKIASFTQN